jgi:hypothetical protein
VKPLTRDQADVLKALAMFGGAAETLGGLRVRTAHMSMMTNSRRDPAVKVLEARGFVERAEVVTLCGGTARRTKVVPGWAITAEGLAALQREATPAT